ncbi:MAG: T9SS type A sorting domain-containing protein, partial [Bacteroidales bacterium]|nr:T9SS type A sorting domain-containing protein [Bacteroidales bacterium]
DKTGQTYKKTGMKFFKGTANDGCPIRDTLYVIISQKEHSYTEVTNCGPYTWDLTGQTYNKSGLKFNKTTNEYGCPVRDTLMLTIISCKGQDDATEENAEFILNSQFSTLNSLKVYPNPTTGRVQLNVTEAEKIEVLDLVGRRVAMFENTNTLDLSGLADGTYTLRVTMHEGVAIRKVVKR